MSYRGITPTKFGRYGVAIPPRFDRLHLYRGEPLREVDHEPPVPVLDQEDLLEQGIHTSSLAPGALDVDALGSCTCNAGAVSLAERRKAAGLALPDGLSTTDAAASESFAIRLYHAVTDQTGDPSTEWPPTDCGSTGLYVCAELEHQGLISGHRVPSDIHALVSLLQGGTVIVGGPWFNAWMDPDRQGFVDGDGDVDDLAGAIDSGVAGGHETCVTAVEKLAMNRLGAIDAAQSHVRVRNSWSASWGDHGSYRIHLSTLRLLWSHLDFHQFGTS